jgi:hypothetical protein
MEGGHTLIGDTAKMRRGAAGALVATLLILATACGSGGKQRYSDEVRRDYLDSCAAGGSSEAYCRCTLGFFEEHYAVAELQELLAAVDRSERLGEFLAVFEECG